ncbi:MAG TPA: hypothetical protein PLH21_04855 [Chiayiivirga sp.]|jgi:hypothetical protein|nr:hypothetical protein [Chiayiivirga sp.]
MSAHDPSIIDVWPYVNQIEDLLEAVNHNLASFQEEAADERPELAKQYLSTAHNLLGATQTIAAALAVKVRVRNELSRGEP